MAEVNGWNATQSADRFASGIFVASGAKRTYINICLQIVRLRLIGFTTHNELVSSANVYPFTSKRQKAVLNLNNMFVSKAVTVIDRSNNDLMFRIIF